MVFTNVYHHYIGVLLKPMQDHARLLVRAVLGNHHFEQPPSIMIPFLKIFEIGTTDTEKDERPLRNYSRGLDNIFGIIHNGGV